MLPGFSALHEYRRQARQAQLRAGLAPQQLAVLDQALAFSNAPLPASRADAALEQGNAMGDATGLAPAPASNAPAAIGLAAAAAAGLAAAARRRAGRDDALLAPETASETDHAAVDATGPKADWRPLPFLRAPIATATAAATLGLAGPAFAARPSPPPQAGSGLRREYMDNVLEAASKFAFIDHAHMNWHSILANEFADPAKSPFTLNGLPAWPGRSGPKVAIVGAGLAGLMTAWQLAKVGMRVTVFEGNPAPTNALGTAPSGGRIYPVVLDPAAPDTRVELGGMRFPMTSYLFWHYISRLGVHPENDDPLMDFPNAGKVPTLFSRRDSRIHGTWGQGGTALPADVQAIATRQILKFINYVPPRPADAVNTDATGLTAGEIAGLVGDQSKLDTAAKVEMMRAWWNWATRDLDRYSYKDFLRQSPDPFSDAEVELAGDVGFGTGGFWTLFPTSALELMRLVLWDYSAEFQLPELYRLPYELMQRCQASGVTLVYGSQVRGFYHVGSTGKHAVLHGSGPTAVQDFDQVVCATSFKVARALLDSSLANKALAASLLGNGTLVVPYVDAAARPGYASAFQLGDFNNQGISSLKVFSTITGPAGMAEPSRYLRVRAASNPNAYHAHTGTFFGAGKVGVTYHLPKDGQLLGGATTAIGLNYAWGVQADEYFAREFKDQALVGAALSSSGVFIGTDTSGGFASRIAQTVSELRSGAADAGSIENWSNAVGVFGGFSDLWKKGANNPSRWGIIHWNNVPWCRMGFKLDFPGKGKWSTYAFQSSALSTIAYREGATEFAAWDAAAGSFAVPGDFPFMRKSRSTAGIFFAGESFSHYGGWVEGALQSALSNAMALYYAAVKGTNQDIVYGGGDVTTTAAWHGLFGGIEAARRLWTSDALVR